MAQNVWFITGAGRGLGVELARAALDTGHSVVATGRDAARVESAIGPHENLLAVDLDITDPAAAESAVHTAVGHFGRIDVLVNNAGNFYAGFFETTSPEQFRAQIETNLFGPLNVTRAVLPVLREQRSGQVITVTSLAGLIGGAFTGAYAASKFALEGWIESLRPEVAPFGIELLAVEPGMFRTELLVEGSSTNWPELNITDYAARTAATIDEWKSYNGHQAGDPTKLAHVLVTLSDSGELPQRFVAGSDAFDGVQNKLTILQRQLDALRDLSTSLSHES
ncbi:SDR family NAD(P)-dependent oxidoreductase [Rhodococcus sp. WS1]|uniref:SDR family NAD(P)-dependent oxidoreductase n=1 Tax=unclassified Rhodococcus (in: high G+C Gram-positive bacteria) TaxID=192944 RepID=UPI001141C00B|nr:MULTISPECIES: SDR family NAD(P)-dependent oxidoreductase [unclassified Rhodococcus (in: high G+C Gram-positive bacteria)]ROZ52902.1 SDR family NAD(P)-dependent oxidoreductase [Rhodococcus sp. WS1]TQC35993.1 SDR family NAD(P)-dependent oxidoreductase [Rhodococcus sp. WS7]